MSKMTFGDLDSGKYRNIMVNNSLIFVTFEMNFKFYTLIVHLQFLIYRAKKASRLVSIIHICTGRSLWYDSSNLYGW